MKKFKSICVTIVLVSFLSIPAFADTDPGDSHQPGRPCPTGSEPANENLGLATVTEVPSDFSVVPLTDILLTLASLI